MAELDATDERIVTLLMRNARATFAEIGEEVNLSAPAVKRRVDRLVGTESSRASPPWWTARLSAGTPRPMSRSTARALSLRKPCGARGSIFQRW